MNRLGTQIAIGLALVVGMMGIAIAFGAGMRSHSSADHSHEETLPGPVAPGGVIEAQVYQPPREIADFTLTDQNGQPLQLSSGNGKVRVIYIGYTQCADVCPLTMINLKTVRQRLGALASQVSFMMITADPAHDTPSVMKTFLNGFDPTFIGLSGSQSDLEPVWTEFGAHITVDPGSGSVAGDEVSHPATLYVLNKDGKLALKIPYGRPVAGMTEDIRGLLE